jgi:D-alanyl-D-alanine carboxypeptidase
VVYFHGEWWFPVLESMKTHKPLALTQVEVESGVLTTMTDLMAMDGAVCSYNMMLINRNNPLPENFEPELIEYNMAKMHPLMKEDYIAVRDDVKAITGVRIYVVSDYRTSQEQEEILQSSQSGVAAQVGCSEHEAGMALDVYVPHFDGMSFLNCRTGRMINQVCWQYGYIVRYPADKEDVTGISYEPWHFRYVGKTHSKLITESGLALEEYIDFYQPEVWYQCEDGSMILRTANEEILLPQGWSSCDISPDNTGYVFITLNFE